MLKAWFLVQEVGLWGSDWFLRALPYTVNSFIDRFRTGMEYCDGGAGWNSV